MLLILLPAWSLLQGCASSCAGGEACEDPRLWYSPESDEEVHFGCEPPSAAWRAEPFYERVGVDLDGLLRGPAGVFRAPTADTSDTGGLLDALGPLPPVEEADTAPIAFGPTAHTGIWDTGFFDTSDTGHTGDTARSTPRPSAVADGDTSEPESGAGDTQATADTGELPPEGDDTAPTGDTFVGDTWLTGDTGWLPAIETAETADTGLPPVDAPLDEEGEQ